MNSVSWMIYFAGVSENVQTLLGIVGGVTTLGGGIAFMMGAIEDEPDITAAAKKALFFLGLPAAFLSVLIPSANTIYAIAASEVGEGVVKSETASKAVKALNAWLDKQLVAEKPE